MEKQVSKGIFQREKGKRQGEEVMCKARKLQNGILAANRGAG